MIRFFRDLIFKDCWLKLFSLALAVLIWFTVHYFASQHGPAPTAPLIITEQRLFANLPVVVLSSAEDVRGMNVNPKEVDVTVKGDATTLNNLQNKDIHVLVDLTGIEAAHDLRKRIEVSVPAGVTVVRVDPQEVQVIYPPRS